MLRNISSVGTLWQHHGIVLTFVWHTDCIGATCKCCGIADTVTFLTWFCEIMPWLGAIGCLVNSHQTISHQSQLTQFLVNSPYIWNKEGLFWGGLMVFSTYCVTRHWVFSTYFGTTISTPISKGEFLWLTIKACSYNI